MCEKRLGSWIQTFAGKQFWPMDARPGEVDIQDIAHALSMLCRFNGHCNRFYSVAEHSVHLSRVVEPQHALWGLLHDAAEAYVSDVPRPVKQHVEQFKEIESQLMAVVADCFGLHPEQPREVKKADMQLLATEKVALMKPEPAPWPGLVQGLDGVEIHGWSPSEAKQAFLDRFAELMSDRDHDICAKAS
ncbi:conserved hypothetical protein [Magnetococcus marinus MC-1]|uniref:Metal dependent phosphohydrolase n=1 Tax=Magnetococcus marinus (strain ATCC BAA-1437 / JCM 17883 / MC-1) TaxID=156889 RepID=A0L753_MAGMM|nr:hypothetical protein [Magnetococcus marinus]ABK43796.1 conserved hypothetical protein [Magnetococcus marinus MC-1]